MPKMRFVGLCLMFILLVPASAAQEPGELPYYSDLVWSPAGTLVAVPSSDGVYIFAVNAPGTPPRLLPVEAARSVAYTPDGTTLAVGSDANITLWGLSPEMYVRQATLSAPLTDKPTSQATGAFTLQFAPDGRRLLSVSFLSEPSVIRIWDVGSALLLHEGYSLSVFDIVFLDADTAFYTTDVYWIPHSDGVPEGTEIEFLGGYAQSFDLDAPDPDDTGRLLDDPFETNLPYVPTTALRTADAASVFVGGYDFEFAPWATLIDAATGEIRRQGSLPGTSAKHVAVSPNGHTIAFYEGNIVLYDVEAGMQTGELGIDREDAGTEMRFWFSPDGTKLAAITSYGSLHIWNIQDETQADFTTEGAVTIATMDAANLTLEITGAAVVTTTEGDRLRLRSTPSIRGELIARIDAGARVEIIGGPVEAEGYVWWEIRVPGAGGITGWAVESIDGLRTLTPAFG
jgi:WD40 repeat protein